MKYCKCHEKLSYREGFNGLVDEVKEFIEEPSRDEASDIIYCLNRLAGTVLGKAYQKVIPGDGLHVKKIEQRMKEYGCIRSKRHLVDGVCPSAFVVPIIDFSEGEYDQTKPSSIIVNRGVVVKSTNVNPRLYLGTGMKVPGLNSGTYTIDADGKMTYHG